MKDFLQGRATLDHARTKSTGIDSPTHFPPITHNTATLSSNNAVPNGVSQDVSLDSIGSASCGQEPKIDLVHDSEGRIGHIIVTCRCGDQITLQCNY